MMTMGTTTPIAILEPLDSPPGELLGRVPDAPLVCVLEAPLIGALPVLCVLAIELELVCDACDDCVGPDMTSCTRHAKPTRVLSGESATVADIGVAMQPLS